MKILFVSDIHGITTNFNKLDKIITSNNFDRIILLGDLFSYSSYDTNDKIINFFNKYKNIVTIIKGNCDYADELSNIDIPVVDGVINTEIDNINMYWCHGHYMDFAIKPNSVVIYGHLHYPFIVERNDITYINVGSMSLPRNNSDTSYLIYDNHKFTIYNFDNKTINSIEKK